MRWLNKLYAWIRGYFWQPCPICGRMFGGHEIADFSLLESKYLGGLVCKKCNDEARKRNRRYI